MKNVTSKSAIAKWVSIVSIRDERLSRRFINNTRTVMLPIDDKTINMLKKKNKEKFGFGCEMVRGTTKWTNFSPVNFTCRQ